MIFLLLLLFSVLQMFRVTKTENKQKSENVSNLLNDVKSIKVPMTMSMKGLIISPSSVLKGLFMDKNLPFLHHSMPLETLHYGDKKIMQRSMTTFTLIIIIIFLFFFSFQGYTRKQHHDYLRDRFYKFIET